MIFKNKNNPKLKLFLPRNIIEPQLKVSVQSIKYLLIALVYSIFTHISHLPLWVIIYFPFLIIWGYNTQIKQRFLPSKKTIGFIVLITIGGVLITYNTYLGKDPGITSLVLLSILKLVELKNHKDYMFLVFLSYFLLFGNFLYDQDIATMFFMIIGLIISTTSILKINYGDNEEIKFFIILKKVFSFIILSLPFMIVLFLFFPRFSTSLSLLDIAEKSQKKGVSGFNDLIRPGSISGLVKSSEPAFRVEFLNNNKPEQKDLYFRGSILWKTDGKYWKQGKLRYHYNRKTSKKLSNGIVQLFTLEPHNRHWLFALDYPEIIPGGVLVFPGNILKTRFRIKKKIRYGITSILKKKAINTKLSFEERHYALQLPDMWRSQILDLGLEWKKKAVSNAEIVVIGLEYFKTNGFAYTLEPGIMNEDSPLEDFLFNKKKGFCEHFAATFALLMRSAGVPARLVVGYQGGEYNNVGDYLLVRQSDAHAWTEVWLEKRGWVRIDPTETVNPERIIYGAEISKKMELSNLEDRDEALISIGKISFFKKTSVYFAFHMDNINRKWDQLVIMYSRYSQINVLKYLGFGYVNRILLFILLIITIFTILFFISLSIKKNSVFIDPVQKIYFSFFKKVKNSGIIPHNWEGPIDFKSRLNKNLPDKKNKIEFIISTYIQLRFGKIPNTRKALNHFRKLVKKF